MPSTPSDIFGFEQGDVLSVAGGGLYSAISGITGTQIAIESGTARTGDYYLRAIGGTTNYVQPRIQSSTTTFVGIVNFMLVTAMPTGIFRFAVIDNEVVNNCWFEITNETGQVRASFLGASFQYSSVNLQLNVWHQLELKLVLSADPSTLDWSIDGVQQTQITQAGTGTNVGGVQIGNVNGGASAGRIHFDDVAYSITAADFMNMRDIKIGGLVPNADGTHNNTTNVLEINDGSDINGTTVLAYPQIDDMPWSTGLRDRIQSNLAGSTNYVEMQIPNVSGTVYAVKGYLEYSSATAVGNNGATVMILSGGIERSIYGTAATPVDMSETTAFFKSNMIAPTGSAWTQEMANAMVMRIGYSQDANPDPYWQAAMLEYAYASGNTYSDTFSAARSLGLANSTLTTHNPSVSFAKSIGMLVSVVGTYSHLLTLGRILSVDVPSELLINSTLSLARLLGISPLSFLSYEALFALGRSLSLISSSQLDAQNSITLGKINNILGSSTLDIQSIISLGRILNISSDAATSILASVALAKSDGIVVLGGASFEASTVFIKSLAMLLTSEIFLNNSLTLGKSLGISTSVETVFVAALSLAKTIDILVSNTSDFQATSSLARSLIISTLATVQGVIEETLLLGRSMAINNATTLSAVGDILLPKSIGITSSPGANLNSNVSLNKLIALSVSAAFLISDAITLNRSHSISTSRELFINQSIGLGKSLGISTFMVLDLAEQLLLGKSVTIFNIAILSINTDIALGKVLSISIIGGLDYGDTFALNLSRTISLVSQVVMFVGDLPAEIIVGDSSVWTMNIADILVD